MRCVLNKFLAGSLVLVFALFAFGSAKAQDFNGFYVGANGGANLGRARVDTNPSFSPTGYFATTSTPAIAAASRQDVDAKRYTFGGQGGYNHQWDNFVLGFEADFGTMSVDGSTSATALYPCCAPTSFTVNQSVKTSWIFTARPRFGFVAHNVLFYETAGIALTSVQYSAVFTDTFATAHESASFDEMRPGYVLGGGGEAHINHHWSVKAEYLYAGFGASTTANNLTAFSPPIAFPTNVFTHSVDLKAHLVRGGVNFRF